MRFAPKAMPARLFAKLNQSCLDRRDARKIVPPALIHWCPVKIIRYFRWCFDDRDTLRCHVWTAPSVQGFF